MTAPKRLIWQLFPSYLLLVFFAVSGATWYASRNLKEFFLDRTAMDLKARATLLAPQLRPLLDPLDESGIKRICAGIEDKTTRITVILASGRVIGDSQEDPRAMENHADRPEFRRALSAGFGMAVRYSRTTDRNLMYVGVPIEIGGRQAAVLRTAIPVDGVDEAISKVQRRIAAGSFLFVLAVGAVGFVVSRRITRPLENIRKCAEHLAEGDFQQHFPQEGCAEIRDLSTSMKKMAVELRDRIDTITDQRNRIDAILSSMTEGVIALDTRERIITMNRAAEVMLDWRGGDPLGKNIQEVARNTALHGHIANVLGRDEGSSGEIFLGDGARIVEARVTRLLDSAGNRIGALTVLNDISDLRRLERVRRDFVANVSHELKTPITTIKGFVETLLYGGAGNGEDTTRFLGIIERHVNRLGILIDDLLMLARIEQGTSHARVEMNSHPVRELIETAVQLCASGAAQKNITIEVTCPGELSFPMDPFLMEQALVNLIDNAVKYSGEKGSVRIHAAAENGMVTVSVIDRGRGIRKEHLPRLFERFYRVDKARSRDQGGTGLGLAIVKHIVQAHGGSITVESTPGEGSTFSMTIPVHVSG